MPSLETMVSLCKRRGYVFQSSEIYGGLESCYDYGPLGVELKRNIKDVWWRQMVLQRDDMVGVDCSILMHPEVWRASGHLESFTDPLVECVNCHHRFRADKLGSDKCPDCGGGLTDPRMFNLMLKTFLGPVEDDAHTVYMRPETAQGIFVNFQNVLNTTRKRLPFGIAQIGKSFRNEITPQRFVFRTREFEQMEIEYFVEPGTDEEWYERWVQERYEWYLNLGIREENLRKRPHEKQELAHYAKACTDIEYRFPWGWDELEGIANRTDFDLGQHEKFSGKDLKYTAPGGQERLIPYVIEPSGGVDRAALAFLLDAYHEEEVAGRKRTVLRLHKDLAPIKIAVLPLLANRDDVVQVAKKITHELQPLFPTVYDDTAAIGKLYRRQDEVGTPYCITVDVDTLSDQAVTVRDRDTMQQDRVAIDRIKDEMAGRLGRT
jgi:glycyl-tRNA synthetase